MPKVALITAASFALLALGGGALADGRDVDWGGYYAGAYVSHNWGKLNSEGEVERISTDEDEVWLGGLFGGHRWELENDWVAGVALEVPLVSDTDGAEDIFYNLNPPNEPPIQYEYDIDYAFLLTGQLGRSYGRLLPYVEGGVGMLGATYRVLNVDNNDAYSRGFVQEADNDHFIWKVGAGLDYAVSDNLLGGVKVSYIGSDQQSYEVPWLRPYPSYIGAESLSVYFTLAYQFR